MWDFSCESFDGTGLELESGSRTRVLVHLVRGVHFKAIPNAKPVGHKCGG